MSASAIGVAPESATEHPAVRAASVRYRPLGALRFVLALMVVLQHFQHLLPVGDRTAFSKAGLGVVAVVVFFVISGFVVAEANQAFYRGRPAAFLVNRLIRVVPPFLAALVLSVVVHEALWMHGRLAVWDYTLHGSPLAPPLLLSGLLGMVPGFHPTLLGQEFEFIPFVWSLRVEMAFYFAAFTALLWGRAWRQAVPVCVAAGLLASAAFLFRMKPGLLSDAPMFLLGVAVCLALRRASAGRWALVALCTALSEAGFISLGQHGTPAPWLQMPLLALLLAAFLCLAAAQAAPFLEAWDRSLGALSYPLYLNHYVVGILAWDLSAERGPALYLAATASSVMLAWGMARLVETPLLGLRSRVRKTSL